MRLNPEETIHTLWIGTNDLGVNSIISGGQTPGVTVVDTSTCAVNWVKALYENGARNFLFQNVRFTTFTMLDGTHSHSIDDTSAACYLVLPELVSKPLLDSRAKHDRLESRNGTIGQRR